MQINANKVLDFCLKVWYKGANANDSHYHLEEYTKNYGCSILHNALPMGLDGTLMVLCVVCRGICVGFSGGVLWGFFSQSCSENFSR